MNTYQNQQEQNFPTNSKILNEFRQVHRQLIQKEIDPKILSLLNTAIFREKIARDKLIRETNTKMEMRNGMRENCKREITEQYKIEENWSKSRRENMEEEEDQKEEEKMDDKIFTDDDDEEEEEIDVENFTVSAAVNESKIPSVIKSHHYELPKYFGEWQKLYEAKLTKKYGRNNRCRFLFLRKLQQCYMDKLRQLKRIPVEILTVNEKRFLKKFDMKNDALVDRTNRKAYICYEDIFTVIYNCHIQSKFGKMRDIFNKLKCQYVNITLFSIQIFFKIRFQLMKRESDEKCIRLIKNF